tara:strand:+ start:408 stop:662 length:255 start_codon:yes stop_codon:yes gene_type:complete
VAYKIIIPKAGSLYAEGSSVQRYGIGEQVDAKEVWQQEQMQKFVENGWAVEIKVQSTSDVQTTAPAAKSKVTKKAPKKRTKKKN